MNFANINDAWVTQISGSLRSALSLLPRSQRYGLRLHDQAADNSHRIEFDATAAASAEDDWIYQFPNVAPTPTAGGEISSVETQAWSALEFFISVSNPLN